MSRINYEKLRSFGKPSDGCFDDLPRTGSWADRRRYFSASTDRDRSDNDSRSMSSRNHSSARTGDTNAVASMLNTYVMHAEHLDFKHKTKQQQAEIIEIILKLRSRLICNQTYVSPGNCALLERVAKLVTRCAH